MSRFTHLANTAFAQLRIVEVDRGGGRWENELQAITTGRGRIAPAGARELELARRLEVEASHVLYAEPDCGVLIQDWIREPSTGRTFRVVGLLPPSVPHHAKILLTERQLPPATP